MWPKKNILKITKVVNKKAHESASGNEQDAPSSEQN
jgi:hypothetical protein